MAILKDLQEQMKAWQAHNFPTRKPHMPILGQSEEMGELVSALAVVGAIGRLSHAHLKAEQGIRGTPEGHFAAKQDAVADIVVFLADYCNAAGIDMETAVEVAWSEVRSRDWVKFPKNGRTE